MENLRLGYLRVSTEEQQDSGLGLEAQKTAILAEARKRGWDEATVTFIEDAGFTGKNLNRPGIQAALKALKQGDADTLVVAKLDRLTRSMPDFASLLQLATAQGWALVALDLGVDTTTPNGEAMAYVVAVFANLERRLIGERTKASLREAARRGSRLGRPVEMPSEVTARIVAARGAGQTLSAIAQQLNDDAVPTAQGGRKWYPGTVRLTLLRADRERGRPSGDLTDVG